MKIIKKILISLLVLAVVIATLTTFQAKTSKAANYLSAPTLPLNGIWSSDHYLTETDDEQWYKIVIPSDGKLNFQVMSFFDNCHWEIYTSDLTGYIASDYLYGEETTPETKKADLVLTAGVYYLKINSAFYDVGKYRIFAQFTSYGVNDQAAISYVSPLNYQLGSTITGALTETDEEDWYKIIIASTGYYSLKVVSYLDACNWVLYNNDLTDDIASDYLNHGEETRPETNKTDLVLSAGIYYVKIYPRYSTGKYTFQFNALTQQNCTHTYSSKTYAATYFHKGYTSYRCTKCGHGYTGNYKPIKKLGKGSLDYYSRTGKGKVKVVWYTVSDASGYQIRYSRKKSMKSAVMKTVKGQSKSSKTLKKLSRRKKYYIQVRAYKKSEGKTVYGKWSAKNFFKTK